MPLCRVLNQYSIKKRCYDDGCHNDREFVEGLALALGKVIGFAKCRFSGTRQT
jgi:hypothetical protein